MMDVNYLVCGDHFTEYMYIKIPSCISYLFFSYIQKLRDLKEESLECNLAYF